MSYVIVGLGNPGPEYTNTRHNTGRIVVENLASHLGFSPWKENKSLKAEESVGALEGHKTVMLLPDTFMNKSGVSLKKLIKSKKDVARLVVCHDDIDLPLGRVKLSRSRGSGGHRGVHSIITALHTNDFIRVRIGISLKVRGSNKAKKPEGEKDVIAFLMGTFKRPERVVIDLLTKDIVHALTLFVDEGAEAAMTAMNTKA